jgi:hypothetical protein
MRIHARAARVTADFKYAHAKWIVAQWRTRPHISCKSKTISCFQSHADAETHRKLLVELSEKTKKFPRVEEKTARGRMAMTPCRPTGRDPPEAA